MSLVKTNANEPLKGRHNDPNRHQNRVFVYGVNQHERIARKGLGSTLKIFHLFQENTEKFDYSIFNFKLLDVDPC